jgi:hypothetical protein
VIRKRTVIGQSLSNYQGFHLRLKAWKYDLCKKGKAIPVRGREGP